MKKTINITIGGMSFQIEEDAYGILENYLKEVKLRFSAYPDSAEIISDMEDRIAEQFAGKAGENKIITQAIVQELITVMGKPEQFGEEKTQTHFTPPSTSSNKRLFRNPDDVILAGVCSGVAAYLGVDSVWVRLVFALTIFFGGFGVLLYLILWVIVPEAKTDTEKMQMRGEPVNLKNIETMVKERVEELKKKDKSSVKNVIATPFRLLGQILQAVGRLLTKLFPFIFKLVGFVITIAASIGLAVLVFATVSLLFNANSPYIDFPFRELAHGAIYYTTIASGFFALFVPVVFIILLGTSLMALKPAVQKMGGLSLLGLWVLALIVLVNSGIKLAPQIESLSQTSPYFRTVTKEYDVKDFSAIELSGADEIIVYPGENFKLIAEGTEKDLENAQVKVSADTLQLNRNNRFKLCIFCNLKSIKYKAYAPEFKNLSASGASSIKAENLQTEALQLTLSGASRSNINTQTKKLSVRLSGASRLDLTGTINEAGLNLSGASRVNAENSIINTVVAELSGASKTTFGDLENLDIKASGASTVFYRTVKNLKQSLSGSSRVRQSDLVDIPIIHNN